MTIKCKIQFLRHLLVIREQLLRMAGAINMITPHAAVFVNNTCMFCCMHESGAADLPWCHILYFTLNLSMISALLSHVKSMLKGTTLNQAASAWILALFQHKISYQVDGSQRSLCYPSMNMCFGLVIIQSSSEPACLMRLVRLHQFGDKQCLLDLKNHLSFCLSGGHSLINLDSNVQTQKLTDDYCK